jgi:hypothetical protein
MNLLAHGTSRAAPGRVRPRALLRGPLPVWAALFVNVLTFYPGIPTLLPIPIFVGQLITQGALVLALLLALLANRGGVVRPSLFLVLMTILATVSLMVSIHNEFILSSTYRACRLIGFTLVLWLLTPWWGRSDFVLLRAHLTCLRVILLTVLAGALVAPGAAFSGGRLSGAVWPIPPTQVAHYAAVLLGCTVVLWFGNAVRGRTVLLTLLGAGAALIAAHTRTALLGWIIGLAVAGASMFLGHARVRRTSVFVGVLAVTVAALFAPVIVTWLWRGQTMEDVAQLTGRTKVWSALLGIRRPWMEEIFGSGLSNQSFNGLPIDSNWLGTYLNQGWFGVFIDAALILVLVLLAVTHRRGIRRAVALFLVTYCVVASILETGLGDASPYTLNLVVAASLLATPIRTGSPAATAMGLEYADGRRPALWPPSATYRPLERPE